MITRTRASCFFFEAKSDLPAPCRAVASSRSGGGEECQPGVDRIEEDQRQRVEQAW